MFKKRSKLKADRVKTCQDNVKIPRGGKMLRGTNRSIIEISETENKYFEKILIFVKPEFGNLPPETLTKEANRMVGGLSFSPMGLGRNTTARHRAAMKKRRNLLIVGGLTLLAATFLLIKIL